MNKTIHAPWGSRPVSDRQFDTDLASKVKPLNAHFESFGDALFSWTNSMGFESMNEKSADRKMVEAFCAALSLPWTGFNTNNLSDAMYFESDAWLFQYVEEKGYIRDGRGTFILLDESNRPIAYLDISTNLSSNIQFDMSGAEPIVREFRDLVIEQLRTDPATEKKTTYIEVVLQQSMMGGSTIGCTNNTIENKRIALPEYYPYLDGGVDALIKDFIESEETVLILAGPPGTGKSSLIASATDSLNLLPIYAKRADVIAHIDFVRYVFDASDTYMAKVAGTSARARKDLFIDELTRDREFHCNQPLVKKEDEEESVRVPMIVVEDADILLAPRSSGNTKMPELLNETDGISSNHTRKIVFTTNLSDARDIDDALKREGRCYAVVYCRLLTPDEAVKARAAAGLPEFESVPTKDVSLAVALRKPRKKIVISNGKAGIGFNN